MEKPYYQKHIFFCTNQRESGKAACNNTGCADDMAKIAKKRAKELGIHGPDSVRVNRAGCLGRCANGPVAVVYPEGVWYTYVDAEDVLEIVESHLKDGIIVERLKI